ncbi:hypothetical protein CRUP_019941 [Coryphaenoides rupestris]|nr:hypothetical protein CRUP_019941 [Coryphaenoides rupestris]
MAWMVTTSPAALVKSRLTRKLLLVSVAPGRSRTSTAPMRRANRFSSSEASGLGAELRSCGGPVASNNITSLPSSVLANATALRWLILDHNRLRGDTLAGPAGLQNHTAMRYLFANHNNLSAVPRDLPAGLQQLRLAHNQISSVHAGTFQGLRNLTVLLLQGNHLHTIKPKDFAAVLGRGVDPKPLVQVVVAFTSCSETGFNDDLDLNKGSYNLNWMESIPDDTPISMLSIPGTHESLTLHGGFHMTCQVWPFDTQLKAGVRFFDVHVGNWFITHQSVDVRDGFWMLWQKMQLEDVVNIATDFLETYTSETLLLRITLHGSYQTTIKDRILHLIQQHEDRVWTDLSVPSLKQVRGKIVFVQSDSFNTGIVYQEPDYPNDRKFKSIEDQVTKIREYLWIAEMTCSFNLVLTDSTASTIFTSPKTVARRFNSYVNDIVLGYKSSRSSLSCLGVITMNFPSAELIKNIIEINPCVCGETGDAGGPDHGTSGATQPASELEPHVLNNPEKRYQVQQKQHLIQQRKYKLQHNQDLILQKRFPVKQNQDPILQKRYHPQQNQDPIPQKRYHPQQNQY